jgi:hypothetical protein
MKSGRKSIPPIAMGILQNLFALEQTWNKKYAMISEVRIVKNLEEREGIKVCRKTVSEWKGWLRDNNYIRWFKSKKALPCGKLVWACCRYYLTPKALILLNSLKRWAKKTSEILHVTFGLHLREKPVLAKQVSTGFSPKVTQEKDEKLSPEQFQLRIRTLIESLG